MLVLWTQNQTLIVKQGLWIQGSVIHCSCAKTMSNGGYKFQENSNSKVGSLM